MLYTVSMISLLGYCSKGNVLTIACTLSLTILIYLSISGTCSSWLVIFSKMLIFSTCLHACSNYPSPRMWCTLKPLAWYASMTCLRAFIIVFRFLLALHVLPAMSSLQKVFHYIHNVYRQQYVTMFHKHSFGQFITCVHYDMCWLLFLLFFL